VALQVHRDHRVPLGLGHVDDHPVAQDARVVHEHVQVAERVDGLAHEPLGTVPVGHVVAVDDRLSPGRDDVGHRLLGRSRIGTLAVRVAAQVVDDDLGTFGREQQRVLAPQAPTGTGDDRDASVERTHDCSFAQASDRCDQTLAS
jgi:hypothetical protein